MTSPPRGALVRCVAVLVVALLLWSAFRGGRPAPVAGAMPQGSLGSRTNPAPATPDEARLVAPWKVGTVVEGYRIVALYGAYDGSFWVLLRKDAALAYLQIVRSGGPANPLATSGPYAILAPGSPDEPGGDRQRLADQLAAVLTRNGAAPVPATMGTFRRTVEGLPAPPPEP